MTPSDEGIAFCEAQYSNGPGGKLGPTTGARALGEPPEVVAGGPLCAREPRSFRDQPGLSAGPWSKLALSAAIQPAQLLRVNDSQTTTHIKSPSRWAGAKSSLCCSARLFRPAGVNARNGYDFTPRFSKIAAAVEYFPVRSCVVDGEADCRLSAFDALRFRLRDHAAVLCAFDLIELDGEDLRGATARGP
jgi:hypothetical protein